MRISRLGEYLTHPALLVPAAVAATWVAMGALGTVASDTERPPPPLAGKMDEIEARHGHCRLCRSLYGPDATRWPYHR